MSRKRIVTKQVHRFDEDCRLTAISCRPLVVERTLSEPGSAAYTFVYNVTKRCQSRGNVNEIKSDER